MATALRVKKSRNERQVHPTNSIASEVGRIVMQTMSSNGLSRVLASGQVRNADELLRKVHTPGGRKMAMTALSKVKGPLYSVRRDAATGRFVIEKGRVKSGEFVHGR